VSKTAELTAQMPFVGTQEQKDFLDGVAEKANVHRADVVRFALAKAFGFVGVGYPPKGKTVDDMIDKVVAEMLGDSRGRSIR
jgi:hypothetical protein